jgi:phytanoyl-CoA hydroxylase
LKRRPAVPTSEFKRHGVACMRGFLNSNELSSLERELYRYIAEIVPSLNDGSIVWTRGEIPEFRVLENFAADPYFDLYGRSEKWMDLAAELLGKPVAPAVPDEFSPFGWQALFSVPPGIGLASPPHQDNYFYDFVPAHTLVLWLALDSIDQRSGGLRYVRGSHLQGVRPHRPGDAAFPRVLADFGPDDIEREVSFDLEPGDVVAHHGLTIHRSVENRMLRRRWGYSMFFRGASCRRADVTHQNQLALPRDMQHNK